MPSTLASRITAVLGTGAVVLAAATGQASGALVTAPVIGTTPNLIADRPFTYPLALAWDITTIGSKTYAVTVATAQGGMVNVIELDTDVAHTGANDATINIFNGPMETSTTEWGASQSTVLPDKSVLFGTNRGGLVWVRPGPSAPATQKALFHLPFAVSTAGADAAKRYYSSISDYTTMLNTYTISHHGDTTTVVFVALRSNQGMDGKIVARDDDHRWSSVWAIGPDRRCPARRHYRSGPPELVDRFRFYRRAGLHSDGGDLRQWQGHCRG